MSTSQIFFNTILGPVSIIERNKKIIYINFKKTKSKKINYRLISLKKKILLYLSGKIKKISGNFKTEGNKKQIQTWNIIRKIPYGDTLSNFKTEGNKKQIQTWNIIRKIPYGDTLSYKAISRIVKTSPRHIGKICSQNKILLFIPCHRVINNNGGLGGFSGIGGTNLKKKLLELEKLNS